MIVTLPEDRTPDEEARYQRLVISYFDFSEVVQFLNQFLALNAIAQVTGLDLDELRRGLTIASIIAYARPFTRNKGAPLVAPSIKMDDVATLTPWQRELHQQMLSRRNRAYAHSDAEMAEFRYDRDHPNGPVPRVSDPRVSFTGADAENARQLAIKLGSWCSSQACEISGVHVIGSRRAAPHDIA